jgi:lysophospholipase L1-like esterase
VNILRLASTLVISIVASQPSFAAAQSAEMRPGAETHQARAGDQPPTGPADRPAPRTDQNSMTAHAQLLEKAKQGRIDVYFQGDSIVRRWGALDYPDLLANWKANFFGWNAANFAWGGDRTQNILWRLENGELDGVNPKVIVLLAGTNNVGTEPRDEQEIEEIARGIKAILDVCRLKAPNATIVLTAIFPRNDNMGVMPAINRINERLAGLADGVRVRFLDINDRLADPGGKLFDGVLNEKDKLHPTLKGYQIWADALKPIFRELLGPPGESDLAPPPTGDPSATRRQQRKHSPPDGFAANSRLEQIGLAICYARWMFSHGLMLSRQFQP